MLFGIDTDSGDFVRLYLVPDSGGATPSLRVMNEGVELLQLEANEVRSEVAKFGRHSTGRIGFVIDKTLLPDLAAYQNLTVIEPDSKIIVYRRPRPSFRAVRMFRLETHLLPLWRFDDALAEDFQYWFKGIDRFGRETANQSFNLINTESIYSSGRMFMRDVEKFIARGLKAVAMIRDPYEELAERMIILKNIGEQSNELLGQRDAMIFADTIAELKEVETFDAASCKRFFKRAPNEVAKSLSSPFVRLLASSNPTEPPPASGVNVSLQLLSQFSVLGLRSEPEHFSSAVAELIEIEATRLPVIREFARVVEVGKVLRQIREVEGILEQDLELFHHMKQAFGSVAASP